MNKQDWRDWFILLHLGAGSVSIMGYAYLHPTPGVFATACGTLTTALGLFHWFTQRDDKIPDYRREDGK